MTRRFAAVSFAASMLFTAGLLAQTAAAPAAATPSPAAAAPTVPTNRILIHVYSDKPEQWQAAVARANEYMTSAKPGTTLVGVLATGDGLKLIDKDNALKAEVMGSLDKDVSFVACHASMKTNHMAIDQLHEGVGTVPSGGREMAMRKAEGWTMMDDQGKK